MARGRKSRTVHAVCGCCNLCKQTWRDTAVGHRHITHLRRKWVTFFFPPRRYDRLRDPNLTVLFLLNVLLERGKNVQAENMAAIVKILKPPSEDGHKQKPPFHSCACIVGCSWAACCDECLPGDRFFFQKQVFSSFFNASGSLVVCKKSRIKSASR